jgi:hypothetical protein
VRSDKEINIRTLMTDEAMSGVDIAERYPVSRQKMIGTRNCMKRSRIVWNCWMFLRKGELAFRISALESTERCRRVQCQPLIVRYTN